MKLPELSYPYAIDTLGKMLAMGDDLWVYCYQYDCHHRARVSLVSLAKQLGMDHGCMHADLVPRLFCSQCRAAGLPGKNIGIRSLAAGPHCTLGDRPSKSV